MKIFLGADHRGFCLKEKIKDYLLKLKFPVEDLGNFKYEKNDDYPDFAFLVGKRVLENKKNLGILICGSGEGMAIAANKIKGILAATAFSPKHAKDLRSKDQINVLCLASDLTDENLAKKIVSAFLMTKVSRAKRHWRRVKKIKEIENGNYSSNLNK